MRSHFENLVPKATVEKWQAQLGGAWRGLHHYCAAIHVFERGVRGKEHSPHHQFTRVVGECEFMLERADKMHPLYAKVLTLHGRALFELGQANAAFADFRSAITLHPKEPDAYAAWGFLLRRAGKREKARRILAEGIEATSGGNAEIHYLLGIVLAELKEYEGALDHARSAYALGYPLPGLKRKLEAAGQWQN